MPAPDVPCFFGCSPSLPMRPRCSLGLDQVLDLRSLADDRIGPRRICPQEREDDMKFLKRLLTRFRGLLSVQTFEADACTLCGHGPNPVTGVPIRTIHGTRLHLTCMLSVAPDAQWN